MKFKQEKGITTASVIVYVIVVSVVITTLTVVTGYFRNFLNQNLKEERDNSEYIQFASYFVQDVQEKGNKVVSAREMEDVDQEKIYYIQFSNGNIYQFAKKNKSIYRNQIEICQGVDLCQFIQTEENGKTKIIINFAVGDFQKTDSDALVFYM